MRTGHRDRLNPEGKGHAGYVQGVVCSGLLDAVRRFQFLMTMEPIFPNSDASQANAVARRYLLQLSGWTSRSLRRRADGGRLPPTSRRLQQMNC